MSSKKLICRKCKGDHLTIKCSLRNNKSNIFNKSKNFNKSNINNFYKKCLVKIYPLPEDLYKKELIDLLSQWGPIGKVNLKKERFSKLQSATIEFLRKSQGLKAIYQLNDTNFDFLKIKVEELNTKNYY